MRFPASYIISLHSKDTTRTLMVEKLFPEIEYETEKKLLGLTEKDRFFHNVEIGGISDS